MSRPVRDTPAARDAGFTLMEALVALAIGAFVVGVIASITGQWLLDWRHAAPALQRAEALATALDRVSADIAAARFVPAGDATGLMFAGDETSVTFVRPSLPVERPGGLEVVRLGRPERAGEATLVRGRAVAPFGEPLRPPSDPTPVTLLRQPYAMRFAYADAGQDWQATWRDATTLPRLVKLDLIDRRTGRSALAPSIVAIHVDAPMSCAGAPSAVRCDAAAGSAPTPPPPTPPLPAPQAGPVQ